MIERRKIKITVNGTLHEAEVEPRLTLVDFLRGELGLTGTHVGCEHGVCGACTILWNGRTVRSCIMLAVQADGSELTTIESMASNGELHPIQQAFIEEHGLQCGFCTPGFVMSIRELLERSLGRQCSGLHCLKQRENAISIHGARSIQAAALSKPDASTASASK